MTKYLWLIVGTTFVKLLMIFVFRYLGKKAESPVIRVMAVDGVLDFFVLSDGSILICYVSETDRMIVSY